MNKWQDYVLKDFEISVSPLTVVCDPDNLVLDSIILKTIQENGYEVIQFEDHIKFRYIFETNYRRFWDDNRKNNLVVLLHSQLSFRDLPYDLFTKGRKLRYSIHDIFPKLSYPIVSKLEKNLFNILLLACQLYQGPEMSDNQTASFILKHLYNFDLEKKITIESLILWSFKRFYSKNNGEITVQSDLPDRLVNYLIKHLMKTNLPNILPLTEILTSRNSFFNFVQNQWQKYLETNDQSVIDFNHPNLRVYMDNFFLEGYLEPIVSNNPFKRPEWVIYGIKGTEKTFKEQITHYSTKIKENVPQDDAVPDEWLEFAKEWSYFHHLTFNSSNDDMLLFNRLNDSIEESFERWMLDNYTSIHNLPYLPKPKMGHHIIRYIASRKFSGCEKIALIVMDGLSLINWIVIKEYLQNQDLKLNLEENTIFSWVPTITNISRQTIFSGLIPMDFSPTINRTNEDHQHWKRFWKGEKGLLTQNVYFEYNFNLKKLSKLIEILANGKIKALGLIINTIDDIVHGSVVGIKGVQENIKIWLDHGFLIRLLDLLLNEGFKIFITSDHGNTESIGIGLPKQGVLVDQKFKRARIYSGDGGAIFREEAYRQFPESIKWPFSTGLPKDFAVLIPKYRYAYNSKASQAVTHGGISIEEVIVPFIEIWR